ncbi:MULTISPECIES: pyridoxal phosphate-dependent aminotransferase [Thermoactinomyces]|jgi:aspartate aminotransferase|uniref:Aminotransferase n=1 Tax=Thermoactinomyces daqus TaxID=1329516 RepID=A0A7W2AIT6_9BACL|nr:MULTISPECIES: pyridoxal phosphate-dependent aminotransferase [Thermoactinomyces]MBA4543600.1 pyridoxal phosphate-dependent aminotransferase [Thermoactinomyces daqus]MBH8596537.1 pyridoxal phosphate-dependent aminotransferase [Thermoactinomyces sp. CICC 10523]MBH8603299.1 pyridoxal phosphate-dependent aminotransferase [Thermoactinomyces sp. CICC 10522]MBH8609047.1 pyridoxal phosphate-dependent aminotransferase [Thermoactinomyces sp. CICC 10521]
MFKLSKRVQQLSPSPTLAITAKAKALKQEGYDVIGLGAGEPDFNTPEHILDAAKQAMDSGKTKYTPSSGVPELKQAIIAKLKQDNGLEYTPGQIIVTVGAKHALYNLFQVLLDDGDEVVVPAPYWVSYLEQVKLAGGNPVVIEGKEENQFKITAEQLQNAITKRTKALILNSPSNPTGMLYSEEELRAIGEVCVKNGILIVSDEIYEHLIYDEEKHHVSMASLGPEFYQHTVIINGVSKTYSMTGWRIGFAAGPEPIIKAMSGLSDHSTSNPTSIAQYAAIAALTGTQQPVEEMKKAFKKRRDYVVERVNEIPGFSCQKPDGAFYAFINIREALNQSGKYRTPEEWAAALLEKELVAVVPGGGFGSSDHIRISYATSLEQLEQALDRIERFVKENR